MKLAAEIIVGSSIAAAYFVPLFVGLPLRHVVIIGFGWQMFVLGVASAVGKAAG